MKNFMSEVAVLFSYPKNLVMLAIRLILSYGFATPALLKINNLEDTVTWFDSMSIPLPFVATYLVSSIETMGIILLFLGLFTRYISLLLSCVMVGAIFFVHIDNGFSVANNGLEIPLYYLIFLIFLATFGAGKYSLDRVLLKDGLND